MCLYCDAYGDPEYGNGLWYLNPKNYSRQMYKLRRLGEGFKGVETGPESGAGLPPYGILQAMEEGPEALDKAVKEMADGYKVAGMLGQVLPLKDAELVMELSSPIGLIACLCRRNYRAIEETNEHEYTCMGMGVGMLKWERWPERYKGGVHFVNPDEAKEWLRRMDKKGFVHCLMPFGAPYIGGFCQCDYPDCALIRMQMDFGFGLLKSHYLAEVDYNLCNGCGVCVQRCKFGALKFEVTTDKANIDPLKCFGCGLCETGCPMGAIRLLDRMSNPILKEVW
jgi:NAD-dependent dihydropyrimidine dehydrogenase PreA subunit